MKTKIVVISDTHCRTWEEIDSHIREVLKDADIVVFNPNTKYTIDPKKFKSRSKNSPYKGWKVRGKVRHTFVAGNSVYSAPND